MSQPNEANVPAEPGREEEDDHDLLTFGEAAARLHAEIRALTVQVTQLAAENEPERLATARRRLELLREAAARNSRQPINDENFARFFGYEGKPRRNTR
jgi:hypothetical protein